MRTLAIGLAALAVVFLVPPAAAADPLGPVAGDIVVDTTNVAPCVGPWIVKHTYTVGPLTVTVITCDPHMGDPPW
jgi:hypothetical protein